MAGGGRLDEDMGGRGLPKGEGADERLGGMDEGAAGLEKLSGEKMGMAVVLGRVMGLERPGKKKQENSRMICQSPIVLTHF